MQEIQLVGSRFTYGQVAIVSSDAGASFVAFENVIYDTDTGAPVANVSTDISTCTYEFHVLPGGRYIW
jgi:hypothetical protein